METGHNMCFYMGLNRWRVNPSADAQVIPHVLQLLILKGSRGCQPFRSRPPLKMSDSLLAIFQAYLLLIGSHWHSSKKLPMHHTSSLDCSEWDCSMVCVCTAGCLLWTPRVYELSKCWSEVCVCVFHRGSECPRCVCVCVCVCRILVSCIWHASLSVSSGDEINLELDADVKKPQLTSSRSSLISYQWIVGGGKAACNYLVHLGFL